ncbi:MAG: hypothetical protein PHT50_06340 [Candidatus Omnitrophica bacterium]|nr:hypothetical protein [Candidatus Omnitrophota bacterium]
MGMVMTFLPWLAFWVLLSYGKLFAAIVIALAASVLAIAVEKISGRTPKILQIGTLAVFVVFALAASFVDRVWLAYWIRLMSNASLTLVVLISILIGKPFTIQYARESVPKEYWNSAEFLHANYVITWVWFAAFVANTAASGLNHFIPSINVLVNWVISICPILVAAKFTAWYSKRGK